MITPLQSNKRTVMATKKNPKKITSVKKPAAKKIVKKLTIKKPVAKKAVTKKTIAKKPPTKKVVSKKPAAKKPALKKSAVKKPIPKKVSRKVIKPITDRYGLEQNDEFYGLDFSQESDEGTREIKPLTYALICLWKAKLGNEDSIDITEDSSLAMLHFNSTFSGGDSDEMVLGSDDFIDIDHIVEVDEDEMMVSMYSYIPKPIPEKLIIPIDISLLNINPEIKYGSIEVSVTVNDENEQEHYLRYRVSVYLKDIKVGKIHAIENMINYGQVFFDLALDSMCVEKEFKKWALN